MVFLDYLLVSNALILLYFGVSRMKLANKNREVLIISVEANRELYNFYGKNIHKKKVEKLVFLILESKRNILFGEDKEILDKNYYVIKRTLMFLSDLVGVDKEVIYHFLQALSSEIEVSLMAKQVQNYNYLLKENR